MKLKRLLINVLLIGGVSLTSCASYSTKDVQEIYNYIQDKGLDNSNWDGLNLSYKIKSDDSGSIYNSTVSIKVTNYNDEFRALLNSSTKFNYTILGRSYEETIKLDIYSESDRFVLRLEDKEKTDNYHESVTMPYNYGIDKDTLMSEGSFYLPYLLELIEDSLSWSGKDSMKQTGSLRETGSGTSISFSASYKNKYDLILSGFYDDTYTEKVKYSASLNYDEDFFVSSYSISIESSLKAKNGSDSKSTTKISASNFNKKISTPSWAK